MDESKKSQNLLANIGLYIDEELKKKLCFQENLIVSKFDTDSDLPTPIGGISVNVQAAQDNKYLVYVNSKFEVESATGGSKITAWITPCLKTIEEKRVEYISGSTASKQTLYLGTRPNHLLVHHGPCEGAALVRKCYKLASVRDLVCEGANLILLRVLAITKYVGEFEVSTFYINGDLCRNVYACTGVETGMVNGSEQEICKIRRTIVERCGIAHHCSATLTTCGRFVNQQWHDCPYTMHVNPLVNLAERDPRFLNTPALTARWHQDIELYSQYLDRRVLDAKLAECYLSDSPGLEELLQDYVQQLLLQKPETEVIGFTADYFQRYFQHFKN